MNKLPKSNQCGMSLLEVVLGIALFAMMAILLFPAINFLYLRQQSNLKQSESTLLAQEALEISFNVVTNNWDTFDFDQIYHPTPVSGNDVWSLTAGPETNQWYEREVRFEKVFRDGAAGEVVPDPGGSPPECTYDETSVCYDVDTKKVVVSLRWNDPKLRMSGRDYELVDYILNPDLIGQVITVPAEEEYHWIDHGLVLRYTFDPNTDGTPATTIKDVSGLDPALNGYIPAESNSYSHISRISLPYTDRDGNEQTLWGLRNMGQGSVITDLASYSDNRVYNQCVANDELTVVAWIRSRGTSQGDPARIVTYSENISRRNFTISQQDKAFNVRLRSDATDLNGTDNDGGITYEFTPLGDENWYAKTDRMQMVTLVYEQHVFDNGEVDSESKARLYLDTNEIGQVYHGGALDKWASGSEYKLALFNEVGGAPGTGSVNINREWEGEIYYLAIHCEAFSPDLVRRQYMAGPNNDMIVNPPVEDIKTGWIEDVAACSGSTTIPAGWQQSFVGGATGQVQTSAASSGSGFDLDLCGSGYGAGKHNQGEDQFYYVYKSFDRSQDAAWIEAKIADYNPSNLTKSAVGVMIRTSMHTNSPYLMVAATKDKGVIYPWRGFWNTDILDPDVRNTTSTLNGIYYDDYPPVGNKDIWIGLQKYPDSVDSGRAIGSFTKIGDSGEWLAGTRYSPGINRSNYGGYVDDDNNYHLGVVIMSSNEGEYSWAPLEQVKSEREYARARLEQVKAEPGLNPNFPIAEPYIGSGGSSNPVIPPIIPGDGTGGGGDLD